MLRGLGKGLKTDMPERELRALSVFNLVDCLTELWERGYFYVEENVWSGEGGLTWNREETECLWLTEKWMERQEEQSITGIQMVFAHFITGECNYLYIRKESTAFGEENVLWISDRPDDLHDSCRKDEQIRGMPPIFERLLQLNDLIPREGVFHKISIDALQEKAKESLFFLLYQCGFRQLRAGWGEVKEDKNGEESLAWAGEFVENGSEKYLYLAFVKREYEEWDSNYGGENKCILQERLLDIYAAQSKVPLTCVCLEGEEPMELKEIPGMEEIVTYLNDFREIDRILAYSREEM